MLSLMGVPRIERERQFGAELGLHLTASGLARVLTEPGGLRRLVARVFSEAGFSVLQAELHPNLGTTTVRNRRPYQ
jgi:hypothetical protein